MDIEATKKRIREIEKERNRLANVRDTLQRTINDEKKKKDIEVRKSMLGKCFYSKDRKLFCSNVKSYGELVAFRIDKISESNAYMECLCINHSDYRDYLYLDKISINPFAYDCNAMITPKDCPKVIDDFNEISEDEFNALCEDVVKRLMEKKNDN